MLVRKRKLQAMIGACSLAAFTSFANPQSSNAADPYTPFAGYVCHVTTYSTNTSALPRPTLYSGPDCTGTYVGSPGLSSAESYTYPEQSDRLYQGFLQAAAADLYVTGTWYSITNPWTMQWVQTAVFHSN